MSFTIGQAISFRQFVDLCATNPDAAQWVVFEDCHDGYSAEMKLFPVTLDNYDIEPEEYESIEDEVLSQGFGNALNSDQVVDIMDNLKRQKAGYTEDELIRAMNFYSERDTFIDMTATL